MLKSKASCKAYIKHAQVLEYMYGFSRIGVQ